MKKIPLIILTGPTAVGKTDLSIKLSKSLNAEIISADSMQIYKYMDIGSAKVTKEEMDGVVHYMIDEVTPDVPFSVSEFQMRSEKYIEEKKKKGKNVLITGGTGLYLNSLIYNMDFAKSNANNEIREKLEQELAENGIDYMHEKLRGLDEEAANRIHKNNTKRVIRAIEVCMSGQKMNDFSKDLRYNEKYKPIIIVLNRDREVLYQRINKRVDIMLENGLLDEVKELLKMGYTKDMISMQGIGYKEMIKYLDGELTWFKRYQDAKWFDLDKYQDIEILKEDIINHIEKLLEIV